MDGREGPFAPMIALGLLIEPDLPGSAAEGAFLPLLEVAAQLGVQPTTVRRLIWKRNVRANERKQGRGYEVDVTTLPPKYRAAFASQFVPSAPRLHAIAAEETAPRYNAAPTKVKRRAELRYEAVFSLAKARLTRPPGEPLAAAEHRWLLNFRRSHPGMKVSLTSVKAWAQKLEAAAGRIDALIDGNDGVKQRGSRIPEEAKQMFRDQYLRAHQPNIRLIYDNVLAVAEVKGWGRMPSYFTFRRYANSLHKLVRRLLRENADTPREVLPFVRRDPTTLPAYHMIQSDHREIDVPVRCDKGCEVCTGKKPRGHFPIWTAFIDIRSRRILGSEISQIITTNGLKLPASEAHLAMLWGVKEVKILSAKYQTQTDPKDPLTIRFEPLWSNIVVIYRKIDRPTIDAPLAGAIVRRKGFPIVHEPHRDHDRDATIFPIVDKWGLMWRASAAGNNRMFLATGVVG